MRKCKNCGTEFEGKFCPECGTKWEEIICPECGAKLAAGVKFCSECGAKLEGGYGRTSPISERPTPLPPSQEGAYREGAQEGATDYVQGKIHSAPAEPRYEEPYERDGETEAKGQRGNVLAFFTEGRLLKIYRALAIVPAAMCALFSVLLFLFCLAPYAVMKDIFTGGKTSLGSIYDYANPATETAVALAAIGLVLAGATFLFLFLPKLKWREVPFRRIPVWGALSALTFAVYFAPFVAACVMCADAAKTDGGMGLIKAGAGPILIIVFALLCLLALGGVWCGRHYIARKFPAFAAEERDARAAVKETRKIPVPDEKTMLIMRLHTVIQWKVFLKWSISFVCISFFLFMLMGTTLSDFSEARVRVVDVFVILFIFLLFILMSVGVLCSKRVRIQGDAQTTMKKCRKWYRGACIAYTIVGVFFFSSEISFLTTLYEDNFINFDRLTLDIHWCLGFLTFAFCVIATVNVLTMILSYLGLHSIKKIKKAWNTIHTPIDIYQINDVREERRARVLRRGFPAAVLAGFLLMTILTVSGVGYSDFSEYRLKKIDFGDPYTTVTRVLGNPDEGRDTTSWSWYSNEYLSLIRRGEKLQQQLANATSEKEIAELNEKMNKLTIQMREAEYRCIVVTFTVDGYVTSVTLYEIRGERRSVLYEDPKPEKG